MAELVKVRNARIEYTNGDVLKVRRNGEGTFRWRLWRAGDDEGEWHVVAANDDAAGVSAAMVGAAAMHSLARQGDD
jgi:hypothetical protein